MKSKVKEFTHCVIEGTPYEVGRQLGEIFRKDKNFVELLTSPFMGGTRRSNKQVTRVMTLYDKYCPGTNDEIKGFSELIGTDQEHIVYYYAFLQKNMGNCSHVALTPSITGDGGIYLGRNYDFHWNDQPILITSRVKGQNRQIGFGCQLFGRFDGMNEYGLCVTTSAGVVHPDYNEEGFVFPVIVRALLNTCKSVGEALDVLDTIHIADYRNFIIVDADGNAALAEVAASKKAVKYISAGSDEKYICSTNHYNSKTMTDLGFPKVDHSIVRYKALTAFFESLPKATVADLQHILSATMPVGVCCHHYNDGMGTLWSMIFNPIRREAAVCFGSPNVNQWQKFDVTDSQGVTRYTADLPNEAAKPGFWRPL